MNPTDPRPADAEAPAPLAPGHDPQAPSYRAPKLFPIGRAAEFMRSSSWGSTRDYLNYYFHW